MPDHEIVIARYNENLDWIARIPDDFKVIVYNKGSALDPRSVVRADEVHRLPNVGRESDTFLTHILQKTKFTDGFTVFLQGDPYEHSPDIEVLLQSWRSWKDLQALSWRWLASEERPPRSLLNLERDEFIEEARVRCESFSLTTWLPLQFFDAGSRWLDDAYRAVHRLPLGINIAHDFLSRCHWDSLAYDALGATVGRFSYGGLFAVRQSSVARLPHEPLELARTASREHAVYGYVIERLWLHMLGEPFQGYARAKSRPCEARPFGGFAPVAPAARTEFVNDFLRRSSGEF